MKKLFVLLVSAITLSSLGAEVDLKSSVFQWTGKKVTGQHTGKISLKSGSVELEKEALKGGSFVIDINTVTVEDLDGEWKDKFLTHMKSPDFFTVEKFPEAKLVIKSVKGDEVKADLTIKGKTNPVSFKYKKEAKTYSGQLVFDRTKFDMVYGSGDFFKGLGDKMIYNDVTVDFKIVTK